MKQNIEDLLELSRKTLDSYIKKTYVKGDKPYKRAEGRKIAQKNEYDKAQSGKGWKEEVQPIEEGNAENKAKKNGVVALAGREEMKRNMLSHAKAARNGETGAAWMAKRIKGNLDTNISGNTRVGRRMSTFSPHTEEVELSELDAKTYKSYSKLSSKEADKSINRFVKGGNEKELTHAEKRSKGINTAQTLMTRKNMKIESVEPLEELKTNTHLSAAVKRTKQALDQKNSPEASRGEKDKKGRSAMDYFKKADKHVDAYVKKTHKEEVTMEYNEETGHIALVNAIFDGNRDEANEIFDTVLSGRINPVVSAKKEELAKTMFAPQEDVTEAYEPLPLTEEAEHGHHHRVHASLTDRKNDLSNEAHNGFMSGNLTKEHKKEVLKHVKAAEGSLDSAKAKLGSAESADHLNAAAVHITDGGLHLQNVRTYTSLGFRGY